MLMLREPIIISSECKIAIFPTGIGPETYGAIYSEYILLLRNLMQLQI